MAKSLGGGFPIGAFWVREKYADLLSPGTHATTFGGTPLGCAVALKFWKSSSATTGGKCPANRRISARSSCTSCKNRFPGVIREVRGFGLMIGIEFQPKLRGSQSEKSPALQMVDRLHERDLLTVPAATSVIRLLPALNLSESEAEEGLRAIEECRLKMLNGRSDLQIACLDSFARTLLTAATIHARFL